jgi:hypothetical protein
MEGKFGDQEIKMQLILALDAQMICLSVVCTDLQILLTESEVKTYMIYRDRS